jgi:hypothetical protein
LKGLVGRGNSNLFNPHQVFLSRKGQPEPVQDIATQDVFINVVANVGSDWHLSIADANYREEKLPRLWDAPNPCYAFLTNGKTP